MVRFATIRSTVTVPRFKLLRSQDGVARRDRANEPYLVTLAVDAAGRAGRQIAFNTAHFPNVRRCDAVEMLGHGHLVYGPENPGEFVAVAVLLMESDAEVRERGRKLRDILGDSAVTGGLRRLLEASPTAGAIGHGLAEVAGFVARILEGNEDDEVIRVAGVFLRDVPVPYDVNRRMRRVNREAEINLAVVPLERSNGQGPITELVQL